MNKNISILVISLVVICTAIFLFISNQFEIKERKKLQLNSISLSKEIKSEIEKTILIQQRIGDLLIANDTVLNFELKTARYFNQLDYLIALELAPDGIIKYVEPLKDNFLIMGYDILSDDSHLELIKNSISSKTPHFIGPIELKQGGTGIISRLPIYKKEAFVGFSIALIDIQKLFHSTYYKKYSGNEFTFYIEDKYISSAVLNEQCIKQPIFPSKYYNLTLNYCLKD